MVQVKENQAQLLDDCEVVAFIETPIDSFFAPIEKAHGRIENRECFVFNCEFTTDPGWNELIAQIIVVKRKREWLDSKLKQWKYSEETAYYVSTTVRTANEYNDIIRNHWGIENRNHRVRDGTFKEDASRIRKNPNIMARIRSFALNIMRINNLTNIQNARFELALNLNKLLNMYGIC